MADIPSTQPDEKYAELVKELEAEQAQEETQEQAQDETQEETQEQAQEQDEETDYSDKEPTKRIHYVHNNMDYTHYVLDFLEHEASYTDIMRSYVTDSLLTSLYLKGSDGTLLSQADVVTSESGEYIVIEVKRASDEPVFSERVYASIQSWTLAVLGEEKYTVNAMFDQVFIGKNNVSLWRILDDAKETDDAAEAALVERDNDRFINSAIFILLVFLIAYILPLVILAAIR
jgi:hypothetical protein